jgi:hypothetical protein
MCVDNDSRPPIAPIAGGSTETRDLRLTSSDGTKFMAYAARAASPTGAGMVVVPDVRGLHPYYGSSPKSVGRPSPHPGPPECSGASRVPSLRSAAAPPLTRPVRSGAERLRAMGSRMGSWRRMDGRTSA